MSENVSPILSPNRELIESHLNFLFGRALSGRIEITSIHIDKEARHSPRTRFFEVGEYEPIIDFATESNGRPGWNTYVGAALRNEDVFPGQAADDSDFNRAYALWADIDDGEHLDAARAKYRDLGVTPPFIVITGRTPSTRAQFWWPLDNPLADINALRAALRGIAAVLGSDPKVCTGKQLMRLGGTVNWPKKEDRILESTSIAAPPSAAREFTLEQLARAFPPLERSELDSSISDIIVAQGGALGLETTVMDGRESYAFKLVRANLREFIGTTGAAPTPDELYRQVAPIYLKKADQIRPGRGPTFLKQKCVEAVRAFDAGQIPGARSLEEAVLSWAERHADPDEQPDENELSDEIGQLEIGPFRASDLSGDPPARQWIVEDWIVENAVNSLYGDGGVGKTLIAQQLACSVSLGVNWLGLTTKQGSVLAVLCEDDKDELHRRHNSIKQALGYTVGNPFSEVWLWPRVGAENELVTWNKDNVPTLAPFAESLRQQVALCRPSLLILDTLTDVYGGDEIQRRQVNYFIKTVLGRMIKDSPTPLTVLLLGHPSVAGKADGRGFSGSGAWNNAVRSRIYLTRPEDGQSDERILTRGKANYAASGDETALRLFYGDGVLHSQADAESDDAALYSAKQEIVGAVRAAWDRSEPYAALKAHRRYIWKHIPPELARAGFAQNMIRQALRECIDDYRIVVGKSHEKRGYRTPGND